MVPRGPRYNYNGISININILSCYYYVNVAVESMASVALGSWYCGAFHVDRDV